MCGIAGIYNFNNKRAEEKELDSLIGVLRHRGPDNTGIFAEDNVGLAHCRLAIVGLGQGGNQPLSNEDKSIWLVCNGEIYNFKELKKELEKKKHRFCSKSDNEIILHLYEEYGLEFVKKIDGMFAFAVWDKNRQRFILGRDRLGIKPLYYYRKNNELIFASEIKGVLAYSRFKKELNYEFFRFYFFHNSIPAPHTPFKNILSLLPAHLLIIEKGKQVEQIRYWQPLFEVNREIDEQWAVNEFLRLLKNSVRDHLPREVETGIALSGGIDSNVLLALAAELSKNPLKTFSCSFFDDTEDKKNEISVAKKLARHFGADHYSFSLSPKDLPEKIEKIIESLDMPVCSFAIDYYLTEKAAGRIKVLFTGDGAEELLGKYWNHRLAQSMAHILEYYKFDGRQKKMENQLLRNYCEILPQRAFQFSSVCNFLESEKQDLFQKHIAKKFKKRQRIPDFIFKNYFRKSTSDFLNKTLEADLIHFLPDHSLNVIDKLSMANSIEIRVPYLDHRLAEFLTRIPLRLKMKSGVTKYLLRRAAEEILPPGLAFGKHGGVTGPPLRRWLTFHLENYVKSVLSPSRLGKNKFINPDFVKEIVSRHYRLKKYPQYFKTDNIDPIKDDQTIKLWKLILFQIWYEKYLL
jgi:asparagine synthase (glutamine-hydrolysing)